MVWNILIGVYLLIWSICGITFFLIKGRLQRDYPEIAERIFAKSLAEHNLAMSLKFQKFSLRSSMWEEIEDDCLITLLQIHRAAFIGFASMLAAFFAFLIVGVLYELV